MGTPASPIIDMKPDAGGTFSAVPGGQIPVTTPPFQPGGATPDPSAQVQSMTQRIMQALAQASQRKQFAGQPVHSAVPGQVDPAEARSIGMNTKNPHAWGQQRFMAGVQGMIQNAVSQKKERDILKAEGDWTYMQAILNEKYQAESSGDKAALEQAQKKVDAFFSDNKKLSKMAKALNQDWLNPKPPTPDQVALQKIAGKTQQEEQQKQQEMEQKQKAATGIKGLFQKLLQRQQEPQYSPEQKLAMGREVASLAPTQIANDPKLLTYLGTQEGRLEIERMKEQANKDLENLKAKNKAELQKPVDKTLNEAREAFESGDMKTYEEKIKQAGQLSSTTKALKTPNEIELITRMNAGDKEAKAAWDKLQQGRKEVRAASVSSRPMMFYDPETRRNIIMGAGEAEARQKAGENLVPTGAVPADKIMVLQRAARAVPSAIDEVEKHLKAWDNPKDVAIFAKIMSEHPSGGGDPSSWFGNILNQASTAGLSEEGQRALIAMRRLNETLGTVRAISALPSTVGSMMATAALAPGAATPNAKMAKEQLDSIRRLVEQETGIELLGGKGEAPKSASGMETQIYNGATYQRKKGSKDQWTLTPK